MCAGQIPAPRAWLCIESLLLDRPEPSVPSSALSQRVPARCPLLTFVPGAVAFPPHPSASQRESCTRGSSRPALTCLPLCCSLSRAEPSCCPEPSSCLEAPSCPAPRGQLELGGGLQEMRSCQPQAPVPSLRLAGPSVRFLSAPSQRLPHPKTYGIKLQTQENPDLVRTPLALALFPGVLPSKASFSMHSVLVNHYLHGAWYPKGGAGEIAFHTIPIIQRAGGNVLGRAPVQSILLDSQGKACGERWDGAGQDGGGTASPTRAFNRSLPPLLASPLQA